MRPTISYFKNALKTYDSKIDSVQDSLNLDMDKLNQTITDQDAEIKSLGEEMKKYNVDLGSKINVSDGARIWHHFQRFAEYDDLKELYKKTVPQIAKYEESILKFEVEVIKYREIIRKFDEHLMTKSNKSDIQMLTDYIDENFTLKKV